MPSKSKSQQRLMGMAYALKKGKLPEDKSSDEVRRLADSMSSKQLKDFAKTKSSNLPNKVKDKDDNDNEKKAALKRLIKLAAYISGDVSPIAKIDYSKNIRNKIKPYRPNSTNPLINRPLVKGPANRSMVMPLGNRNNLNLKQVGNDYIGMPTVPTNTDNVGVDNNIDILNDKVARIVKLAGYLRKLYK